MDFLRANDRSNLRRRVRVPCQVVADENFELVGDWCTDLCMTGMGVRACGSVFLGEPVVVSFRIPDSSVWCDTEGYVARIDYGRRDEDPYPRLGIHFSGLEPVAKAVLQSRLRGLPPPIPRRRPRVDYAASLAKLLEPMLPGPSLGLQAA